ncbi:sec-independent periplasmic protein translocation protein TatC [Streptococcus equinus]|uniref:sec-independent periplasmic protein translocation protein TatC n=1 Tax=Streptococcus equinus TaxID=1335 RepID=UPI00237B92E9|nr:sec-independent periplasmic protein translocation protein TatC [Streptococcus equinus]
MKMNFKSLLAGNLITVIIIFVLLSFFDQSGDPVRNIIVVLVGFVLMTSYDFIRTRKDKKK